MSSLGLPKSLSCAALCLAFVGCSSPAPNKPTPGMQKSTHTLRVENPLFAPSEYRAKLRLDPAEPTFTGVVEIRGEVRAHTSGFHLNGHELKVEKASLQMGQETLPLLVRVEDEDWLYLESARVLVPGTAVLRVEYSGNISETSSYGIFRQKTADSWYLFTQFESRGARRAFPSLDQPDSKVPWELAFDVPSGMKALANTPEVSRKVLEGEWTRYQFAKSPPLPSYLVAFAVGPFDLVDIGKTREGVLVRVATPKGRASETSWVVSSTLKLVSFLEDYAGISYPYAKLDLVSIPATGTFGAMENPGLITYVETLLLSADNPIDFQQSYASVGAHELAHQWFGNLVTNAWWNDIWLNESFATWAAAKTVTTLHSEWGEAGTWVRGRDRAMDADRLGSARVIRQPVETAGDIGAAFDGITYAKGAAVLAMFEGWMGEELFQKSIAHYLKKNSWKAVRAEDFLSSMDEASGMEVSQPFQSFITQPGTPKVHFEVECEDGKAGIRVKQERYLPLGSTSDSKVVYQVPLCIRLGRTGAEEEGSTGERHCMVLKEAEADFPLPDAMQCPGWINPNDGGTGYYRSSMRPEEWARTWERAPLRPRERMALSSDLLAAVAKGDAEVGALLQQIADLFQSENDELVLHALSLSSKIRITDDNEQTRYRNWLKKHIGRNTRRVGRKDQEDDGALRRELRTALLRATALRLRDRALLSTAQRLGAAYLRGEGVNPDQVEIALRAMARGDEAMLTSLIEHARATQDRGKRRKILQAIGGTEGEGNIQMALALMLDPDFDVRESQVVLSGLAKSREAGPTALKFLIDNVDTLRGRYGEEMQNRLTRIVGSQCRPEDEAAIVTLLDTHFRPQQGGERASDQALEGFRLCTAAAPIWKLPKRLP